MLRFDAAAGKWEITIWEEASAAGRVSQDASLVCERGAALRLAVIDGVTPAGPSTPPVGADIAVWAAAVVRTALLSDDPLAVAIVEANTLLNRSGQAGMAAMAACDIGETIELLRAGDCCAWGLADGEWQPLLAADTMSPGLRRDWERLREEGEREAAAAVLSDPARWRTTALGRFDVPLLEYGSVPSEIEQLVLASDGARLDAGRVANLDSWLEQLRSWEAEQPVSLDKRHDDVTVCRLRRCY